MTSDSSRPLAGVSLPQWMKSKITDKYDLDQSAFSPPNHDDGFFLIRYNKSRSKSPEKDTQQPKVTVAAHYKPISDVLKEQQEASSSDKKFTHHTAPCQQFIPKAKSPREIGLRRVTEESAEKIKSVGIDDGFKGDAAACGYSVLQVAQTMVSGNKLVCPPATSQRVRRNSKSLPASPLTSPKLLRKNPFFTDSFFGSNEGMNSLTSRLSGIIVGGMGSRTTSQTGISSTVEQRPPQPRPSSDSDSSPPSPHPTILRAKPSELREMNFWSPTSM